MIFKVTQSSGAGFSFVESMHIVNISEEATSIIKKTKQHFLPSIYLKVFSDILEDMPEEVQNKVKQIMLDYDESNKQDDAQDLKIVFNNLVDIFQHIASLYNKTQDLQKNINIVEGYLKSASTKSDITKIVDYLKNTIKQSNILITTNLSKLKKEYTGMKIYVQGINDPSVYHKIYTTFYHKIFFEKSLNADMSALEVDQKLGLGVFFVKFKKSFLDTCVKNVKHPEKNIEANLMGKALSSSLVQHLRKMDYVGVLDDDLFVVVFKDMKIELLKHTVEDMTLSLSKTKMFTVVDLIELQVGGFFVNNPSIHANDIFDAFEHIEKKLEHASTSCVIEDYMGYLSL